MKEHSNKAPLPLLWRLGVFAGLAITTLTLCNLFPNAATSPESGVHEPIEKVFPSEYKDLVGSLHEMSEEEKKWLPGDTTFCKAIYCPPSHSLSEQGLPLNSITATLILKGSDKRSLHRPEVCLGTGQGWTIEKREVVKLHINNKPLRVMDLHLSREHPLPGNKTKTIRAHYIYWWIGKNTSTPHTFERAFISLLNNMFKNVNDRWAYPSVMVYVDESFGPKADEQARKKAYEFIKRVAPYIQKSLS